MTVLEGAGNYPHPPLQTSQTWSLRLHPLVSTLFLDKAERGFGGFHVSMVHSLMPNHPRNFPQSADEPYAQVQVPQRGSKGSIRFRLEDPDQRVSTWTRLEDPKTKPTGLGSNFLVPGWTECPVPILRDAEPLAFGGEASASAPNGGTTPL